MIHDLKTAVARTGWWEATQERAAHTPWKSSPIRGRPGDFPGTSKPVPGTFRGFSAEWAGKALAALKDTNALGRAYFLNTR